MQAKSKSILVRADFVLGQRQGVDRRTFQRWRRILLVALPGLLGCERRCPRAERIRLRSAEEGLSFSGWLRIPIQRRPGRKRARKLQEKLRRRLELSLQPIDGQVIKLGLRRCRPRLAEAFVGAPSLSLAVPAGLDGVPQPMPDLPVAG